MSKQDKRIKVVQIHKFPSHIFSAAITYELSVFLVEPSFEEYFLKPLPFFIIRVMDCVHKPSICFIIDVFQKNI